MLILVFVFSGCNLYNYDGWQNVEIENCGTFSIPGNWSYFIEDDKYHFVDENSNPMMIQTYSFAGFDENEQGQKESNAFFEEVQCLQTLSSAVLSNGSIYGKVQMLCNGQESEKFYINLDTEDGSAILFIFWDNSIDKDMVEKIANSFVSC